ncbi:MAG TPA: response regulator transcription factor [Solirubrobacteraceae bacterium]|nr:response regulator transcription factor [Solirubrobacteraceae bacterium]
MAGAAVLLVDDDASIRRMLERTLSAEGYDVTAVADGGAALAGVERSMPDLIVLDVAMPGVDGLAVTRRLRGKGLAVPILLLTARDALEERVAGLDAGADDYLLKPFDAPELSARIRALLRRNRPPGEQLAFDDLVLDPEAGVARRAGDDLGLTRREAQLLELLLRNPRRVVTREVALEQVWGGQGEAGENVVDRYVGYLRRKLGDPPLIHTVRGVGFRLDRA